MHSLVTLYNISKVDNKYFGVNAIDEVDRITLAWKIERPDLNFSSLHVYSRVTRLAKHLHTIHKEIFSKHKLDNWEFEVLATLRLAAEPYSLTPGMLMSQLMVSSGTISNRIDRLEANGMVKRSPSPQDKRAVLVTLTKEGLQIINKAIEDLVKTEEKLIASLNAQEQQELSNLLRKALIPLETNKKLPASSQIQNLNKEEK